MNRAQSIEAGFATIPILLLIVGFSVIASALLVQANAYWKLTNKEVQRQKQDLALKSAAHVFVAELHAGKAQIGLATVNIDGVGVYIRSIDEQSKTNINLADKTTIAKTLKNISGLNVTDTQLDAALTVRQISPTASFIAVKEFADALKTSGQLAECMDQHFTVYGSTINPLVANTRRHNAVLDGAIVTVMTNIPTSSQKQTTQQFKVTALLTGLKGEPVRILKQAYKREASDDVCTISNDNV